MNWITISQEKDLTTTFMREHKDQLRWDYISCNVSLTETFMEEMKDYVDWKFIFRNQNLSCSFIMKHMSFLSNFTTLALNEHLVNKLTKKEWDTLLALFYSYETN